MMPAAVLDDERRASEVVRIRSTRARTGVVQDWLKKPFSAIRALSCAVTVTF
jgi:hypothetical protein